MSDSAVYKLIDPVLTKLCDLYIYKQNGFELDYESFMKEINGLFGDIKKKVVLDEKLAADYQKIEKPLVFFVDYFIKESGFQFSHRYVPIAHSYNELSGDDKFFDLFEEYINQNNPDKNIIELFYVMFGLGFDGSYRREPVEVIKRMQKCAEILEDRSSAGYDLLFVEKEVKEKSGHKRTLFTIAGHPVELNRFNVLMLLSFVCLFLFLCNLFAVGESTYYFRDSVDSAVDAASPYRSNMKNLKESSEKKEASSDAAKETDRSAVNTRNNYRNAEAYVEDKKLQAAKG